MKNFEIIKEAGSYLTSLGTWLLKNGFNKEKLEKKIVIDLLASRSAVNINCSDNPNIRVWMSVRNYTPFKQKIDNMTVTFYQGAVSIKLRLDRKQTLSAFSEETIYLNENITPDQARQLALADDESNSPRIDYYADFVCRLHEIQKFGSLNSLSIEKMNAQLHYIKAAS